MLERAVSTLQDDFLPFKSGSNPPVSSILRSSEPIPCDYSLPNRILFQRVCHGSMAYTTQSGGVKFLHSVVRSFMYLFTVTPLCEYEFQLYVIRPRSVRCIQIRSKSSQLKTQLVLRIFILFEVTTCFSLYHQAIIRSQVNSRT
jgi:hypothetical protein